MKRTIAPCLFLIIIPALVGSNDPIASHSARIAQRESKARQCGFRALYVLLKLEGIVTTDNLIDRLPVPSPGGYSMLELRQAAHSCGLILDGVDLGRRLAGIGRPMIALIEMEGLAHYLVVRPVGTSNRRVQVLDTVSPPFLADIEELVETDGWTGLALLPSRPNRAVRVAISLAITGLGVGVTYFFWKVFGRLLRDR